MKFRRAINVQASCSLQDNEPEAPLSSSLWFHYWTLHHVTSHSVQQALLEHNLHRTPTPTFLLPGIFYFVFPVPVRARVPGRCCVCGGSGGVLDAQGRPQTRPLWGAGRGGRSARDKGALCPKSSTRAGG